MPKPSSKVGASYRITRILAKGSLKRGSLFDVKRLENKAGRTRYTIIVSKKAAKLAVDRNRIKRRIKEALAKVVKGRLTVESPVVVTTAPTIQPVTLTAPPTLVTPTAHFDYIFIGKSTAKEVEFSVLVEAIEKVLPK